MITKQEAAMMEGKKVESEDKLREGEIRPEAEAIWQQGKTSITMMTIRGQIQIHSMESQDAAMA